MFIYSRRCNEGNCAFCTLYNDGSTWREFTENDVNEHDNYSICTCCDECDCLAWQYNNYSIIDFIKKFHGENADDKIVECDSVVKEFFTNIANNIAPADGIDKFNLLYMSGCYMKEHVLSLLHTYDKTDLDINKLVTTGSVETNLYFASIFYSYTWIQQLFIDNRFDVLDAMHASNSLKNYGSFYISYRVLNYFNSENIPISNELLGHMGLYFGTERVLKICMDISNIRLEDALKKLVPDAFLSHRVNLDNLPASLETLNCNNNKLLEFPVILSQKLDRLLISPGYNIYSITCGHIREAISGGTFDVLSSATKLLVSDTDTRKDIITNLLLDKFDYINHYRPELYRDISSGIIEIIA